MNIASDPLFYFALGFAGMFLCAWLFDRAHRRYIPDAVEESEPAKPPLPRALPYMIGTIALAIIFWFALYKTSLLVADLLLLAALASFSIASYKFRLRPLLARGLVMSQLAALVVALGLWTMPILWFMHLHLAGSYGAA